MAGISNIIGSYNINPRKVSSKLSFEIGQVFAAKVVAANELKSELILKLLDGWQFPAKLENSLDFIPEGLIRFEVEGFKDGKLQLRIVKDKKEQEEIKNNNIEDLIQKSDIDIDKSDYEVLKKMIKHNMPLTKENIASVKTILDFKAKITEAPEEEEKFVFKYLSNRGIDAESSKGKEAVRALKEFFSALKDISSDEVLTMLQNDIELTAENINSFKKLSNEENVIYKELKELGEAVELDMAKDKEEILKQSVGNKNSAREERSEIGHPEYDKNTAHEASEGEREDKTSTLSKALDMDIKAEEGIEVKEIEGEESFRKPSNNNKAGFEKVEAESTKDPKTNRNEKGPVPDEVKPNPHEEKELSKAIEKDFKDIIKSDRKAVENIVKEQIAGKVEEMKNVVKSLLKEGSSPEDLTKLIQNIKEYVNDFKVFNSLSNQYYYLDVPVNISKDEYQCKLLIKDDRKSGKKIDSSNVSLVVSVKASVLGMVDAYIKVKNHNMSIDFRCQEPFTKILSLGKENLIKELSGSGYNAFVSVTKTEKEATLSNCSEFFDDNNLSSINTRA